MEPGIEYYYNQVIEWLQVNLLTVHAAVEWSCIVAGLAGAYVLGRFTRPRFVAWIGRSVRNEVVRSLILAPTGVGASLAFVAFAQVCIGLSVLLDHFPRWMFAASDLALAWVAIRLLTLLIPNRVLSRLVAVLIWLMALLQVCGLQAPLTAYLQGLTLSVGGTAISLYGAIKGVFLAVLCLQIASAVSRLVARWIRTSTGLSPSLQVLTGKLVNVVLYTAALLLAMSSVGIDLTSFAIFSSAVGVGVGFGLKTIFSNYIAGILLLADKSIKPGDTIEVGGVFGTVHHMFARYASVLTRDGKEYLIPNERMITNEVVNWTYSNKDIRLIIPVGVSYESDPHQVKTLLEEAASRTSRILKIPEPKARLAGFGDSSIDMELCVWISDANCGVGNVKSEVLFNIWDSFKENNITIPFPQREIRLLNTPEDKQD
ncbi:MscS Mechanosensitive ion channel [Pseudodesulfovibrio mercurii]|uniref:MscS Mechanosensitive ion channel n=1 Tax=Pseudodesulfovibrio mercurii TaxID=641491 RepID=F0JJL4_9BACT|nr:mechanosensitive ion channel domain-containing protein [Pseudodesulfovibrio mercurii]EGB16113.1 MscS Mechanosensitive ion channel [Pseudodesulfovibrio mercurii]